METFLLNLLKTSLLGSLAVLTMLALKPLWRERYRAKTRCWLSRRFCSSPLTFR